MNDKLFLALFFGIPALIGVLLARSRGRNPWIWGALTGVIPFFLLVLYFELPKNEVPGHFRKCVACGRTFPWKNTACKYCGTSIEVL